MSIAITAGTARSAISRSPTLRSAVKSRRGQWLIQTVRGAGTVKDPWGFVTAQFAPNTVRQHQLRGSGLTMALRHCTRDVDILNEIFSVECYAPPPEVARRLDAIGAPSIMDLGANIGLFGLYVLGRWPDSRVVGFEPDVANAELLDRTIVANALADRWRAIRAACSNQDGIARFATGHLSESKITDVSEGDTVEVPMVDAFDACRDADLVKMDIEGAEWAILTDRRLSELRAYAIVLEWHLLESPEPDAAGFATHLLRSAGFVHTRGQAAESGGNGLLWAWR
jgi:FkbM family methyltransferase